MRHIDLDIRPMAWATTVKIDGEDMPCDRVAVVCDMQAGNRPETRVELSYYLIDESGSYHEPAVHVAGLLLDEQESVRYATVRGLLERLHPLASERVNGRGEHFPPSPELAALLPEIEAALGWGQ